MAKDREQYSNSLPSNPLNQWPWSGDVNQWMRTLWFPWSDFLKSTTGEKQVGLINVMVDEMKAGNAEREWKIVTDVASYGKQLDRINDALHTVIALMLSQTETSKLKQDDRRALENFSEMFKEIAAAKGERIAPTDADLDGFLEEIRDLKDREPQVYRNMLKKLREFTKTERSS